MNFLNHSKQIIGALLVVVIVFSGLLAYRINDLSSNSSTVLASEYTSLGLSVTPEGNTFKLGVNESKTFTATATNGTAPFNYTWTINPSANFTLSINGENCEVTNASSLQVTGPELSLSYPQATEEYVSISATVTDSQGFCGSLLQPIIVADPYTSPGYKFEGSTATATYIVQADGKGWYRAIKGSDGSIAFSSTSAAAIFNNIKGNNRLIKINNGLYSIDSQIDLTGYTGLVFEGESYVTYGSYETELTGVILLNTNPTADQSLFYLNNTGRPVHQSVSIIFRNLQLDGNWRNSYVSSGITAIASRDIDITNCYIHSFANNGIAFTSAYFELISNCVLGWSDTDILTTDNFNSGDWLPNGYNILIDGAAVTDITYNIIAVAMYTGIHLTGDSNVVENVHILGNFIGQNGGLNSTSEGYGIHLDGSSNFAMGLIFIDGFNKIDANNQYGIYSNGFNIQHVTITNNDLIQNGLYCHTVKTPYGIYINNTDTKPYCYDWIITNNRIQDLVSEPSGTNSVYISNIDSVTLNNNALVDEPIIIGVSRLCYTNNFTPSYTGDISTFGYGVGINANALSVGNPYGNIIAAQFTSSFSGILSNMSVYLGAVNGHNVRVAVYSDNASAPNALLDESASTAMTTDGWQTITGFNISISANTKYWLAFQVDSALVADYYSPGPPYLSTATAQAYDVFPDTFPVTTPAANNFVMFATAIR